MSDKELEELARKLCEVYFSDAPLYGGWDIEDDWIKERWIKVAEFISIRDTNTEHRAMYGSDLYIDPLEELMDRYPKNDTL